MLIKSKELLFGRPDVPRLRPKVRFRYERYVSNLGLQGSAARLWKLEFRSLLVLTMLMLVSKVYLLDILQAC